MKSLLEHTIQSIPPLHADSMTACKARWSSLAKPVYGMGKFEDIFMQFAGITASADIRIEQKALVIFCADNGVVKEGVSQSDSSVTAKMAELHTEGRSAAYLMARQAHVSIVPVDVGMKEGTSLLAHKRFSGTHNIAEGPAMSPDEILYLIETGIQIARDCKEKGIQLLIAGDLGSGNTTAAAAITSVLLKEPVENVTGKGSGLSFEAWKHKKEVIAKAIEINAPERRKPLDVLAKVGSADIAAMTGLYIGAAASRLPVAIDGFASAAAALTASKLSYMIGSYIFPTHISKEPGMQVILKHFHMSPVLDAGMNIGEGTGALAIMPALDMAQAVYHNLPSFEELHIKPYEIHGCH